STTEKLAIAAPVAVVLMVALALFMRRHAQAFPLLAIAALPFRLPISADGRTVNLLIPLYMVVGAGTLAYLLPWLLARGRQVGHEAAGPPAARARPPRGVLWLDRLLFATVLLYGVQAAYSSDATKALENLAFFYIP